MLFKLALRNVFRNKRRSLLTLLALAVGISSSNLLASLARGMSYQMVDSAINNLTGHLQIHAPGYRDDPVVDNRFPHPYSELQIVLSQPPITKWAKRVRVPAVIMSERESAGVTLVGTTEADEEGLSFITEDLFEGVFPQEQGSGILLGKKLVQQLKTKIGRKVVVMSQDVSGKVADRGFRIVGVFDSELESTEKSFAFIGRRTAQKMLKMGNDISEISMRTSSRDDLEQAVKNISAVARNLDVATWPVLEPLVTALVEIQGGFLYIWFAVVTITISFGLANTLIMSIMERIKEIGLYQALGMTKAQVIAEIIAESSILLFFGMIVGNVLTVVCIFLLRDGIDLSSFSQGTEMFGMSSIIYPNLFFSDALAVNLIAFVIGTLASFYPAWRAGKLDPARALTR